MKIEVGKWYEDKEGEKIYIAYNFLEIQKNGVNTNEWCYPYIGFSEDGSFEWYTEDGETDSDFNFSRACLVKELE